MDRLRLVVHGRIVEASVELPVDEQASPVGVEKLVAWQGLHAFETAISIVVFDEKRKPGRAE